MMPANKMNFLLINLALSKIQMILKASKENVYTIKLKRYCWGIEQTYQDLTHTFAKSMLQTPTDANAE